VLHDLLAFGGSMEEQLYREIEDTIPFLQTVIAPQIQESFDEVTKLWTSSRHLGMYSFGCMFSEDLRKRFKSNEDLWDGEYKVRRKNNVYIMGIGAVDLHTHRVDQKSGIPRGAKAVKKSLDAKTPVQMRYYVKDGKLSVGPECPGNLVLAINAHPESGLKDIFVGVLGNGEDERYVWRKIFPVYSQTCIDNNLLESAFLTAEEENAPVVTLQDEAKTTRVERPIEETEPGKIVHMDDYKNKRNIKEAVKE
jgi:hypothetical protein